MSEIKFEIDNNTGEIEATVLLSLEEVFYLERTTPDSAGEATAKYVEHGISGRGRTIEGAISNLQLNLNKYNIDKELGKTVVSEGVSQETFKGDVLDHQRPPEMNAEDLNWIIPQNNYIHFRSEDIACVNNRIIRHEPTGVEFVASLPYNKKWQLMITPDDIVGMLRRIRGRGGNNGEFVIVDQKMYNFIHGISDINE